MIRAGRSLTLALGLALVATFGVSFAATATDRPVMTGEENASRTIEPVDCPPDAQGHVYHNCRVVLTAHAGPHLVLPDSAVAAHSALACSGHLYINWWTDVRWTNALGNTLVYSKFTGEDWYNFCSAGNVWTGNYCTTDYGWSCIGDRKGSFWDGGRGANTDWNQQQTVWGICIPYVCDRQYQCFSERWYQRSNGSWYYQGSHYLNGGYC